MIAITTNSSMSENPWRPSEATGLRPPLHFGLFTGGVAVMAAIAGLLAG
jgi:hypothetical protein